MSLANTGDLMAHDDPNGMATAAALLAAQMAG
jgi:hypothetical protein